jgi:hypothetical protein
MTIAFAEECAELGRICAAAKLRLDAAAPEFLRKSFLAYSGPRHYIGGYFERKVLNLRLSAVSRGLIMDKNVTPPFLRKIVGSRCPVTLDTFLTTGKSHERPTLDRLVNEVTYTVGNICALAGRANRAKGDKTFEEVISIAEAGQTYRGLGPVEWMRMASLMYGAWACAYRKSDPFLLPLAALAPPGLFTSTSQVVQMLLIRHYGGHDEEAEATKRWLTLTEEGGGTVESFLTLTSHLKKSMEQTAQPVEAWLHADTFASFVNWYNSSHRAVIPAVEALLKRHQTEPFAYASTLDWSTDGRLWNHLDKKKAGLSARLVAATQPSVLLLPPPGEGPSAGQKP